MKTVYIIGTQTKILAFLVHLKSYYNVGKILLFLNVIKKGE